MSYVLFPVALSGCVLFFDDGGQTPCLEDTRGGAEVQAALRNPEALTCESFGGGCNEQCGPCPAETAFAPIPSWGICGSSCEGLGETDCAARADCRVVKDARCMISLDCATDFIGCFPTDNFTVPDVDCHAARDGFTCSQSNACTALHTNDPCPAAGALDAPCPRPFALCIPEGTSPGRCFDEVLCDRVAPSCPEGTVPGVENGCYTDACIPKDLCEQAL
ncbi:MAG TPA: hypothetical protein VFQ53_14375 [Kofleriaceae bacterium]|nr:hypothetical protein [Kofleriaceae bacterium]